ncbi:MAG: hypothetical protein LBR28_04405 [Bacteroidales bacterium]|nr:hypothetical protein [Bacteroidales bacterium]
MKHSQITDYQTQKKTTRIQNRDSIVYKDSVYVTVMADNTLPCPACTSVYRIHTVERYHSDTVQLRDTIMKIDSIRVDNENLPKKHESFFSGALHEIRNNILIVICLITVYYGYIKKRHRTD